LIIKALLNIYCLTFYRLMTAKT